MAVSLLEETEVLVISQWKQGWTGCCSVPVIMEGLMLCLPPSSCLLAASRPPLFSGLQPSSVARCTPGGRLWVRYTWHPPLVTGSGLLLWLQSYQYFTHFLPPPTSIMAVIFNIISKLIESSLRLPFVFNVVCVSHFCFVLSACVYEWCSAVLSCCCLLLRK